MKKILLILTLALVALAGCKKETQEPVPEQNEPAPVPEQEKFVITPAKDSEWAGGAIQISANREVASWSHEMVIPEVGDKANYSESSSLSTSISESGLVTLGMYLNRFAAKIFEPTTMTLRITATSVDGETATCEVASMGWATRFYLCSDEEVRNPEKVAVGDIVCLKFTDLSNDITDEEFLKNVKVIADNGQVKLTPVKREGNHFQYKVEKTTGGKITLQLGIKASYGAYTEEVSEVDVLLSTKKVSDISITMSKSEVKVGYMVRATATVSPEDATNSEITWSSSNIAIAKVRAVEGANNKVDVIGVSPGSVIITATARDGSGVTASVPVTVIEAGAEGEGSGDDSENETSYIKIKSSVLQTNIEMYVLLSESQAPTYDLIEGLDPVYIELPTSGSFIGYYRVRGKMSGLGESTAEVKIKGDITNFACIAENLTAIDVSNAPNLIELQVQNNELKSLDVSKNSNLEYLLCSENQLTSLDVSKNSNLEYLSCSENQLTSLDVSKNDKLKSLGCTENQLTSLLVSDKVVGGFEYLTVYKNNLSEEAITALINSMPEATNTIREFNLKYDTEENNKVTDDHVKAAKAKNYVVYFRKGSEWEEQ